MMQERQLHIQVILREQEGQQRERPPPENPARVLPSIPGVPAPKEFHSEPATKYP